MFKHLFIGAVIVLGTSISQAALQGKWMGFGQWNYQGSGTRCDVMTLGFSESHNKLQRLNGSFDCGMVSLDLPAQEFLRDGNNLLIGDQIVGSVDGDRYQWTEQYSETVKVNNVILVEGTHLTYSETWIHKDGSTLYQISGRLFKSN